MQMYYCAYLCIFMQKYHLHKYAQNMCKYANQIYRNMLEYVFYMNKYAQICRNMQKDKYAIICNFKYA